jgi:Fe-S oxidoreductase
VLWPDTFSNFFDPQAAQSALRVLRAAGFRVSVPTEHVCCGRPLYDFGFLDEAKRYMLRNVDRIGAAIDAGLPVVVLEPSCASVFRDDAPDLLPDNVRVQKLAKQTYLLSEFLEKFAPDWQPPQWPVEAIVQGHCHHKALMKMNAEEAVLRRMGARVTVLDSGCCGMAGPFGFEKDKFEVSQTLANRVLIPAVQAASLQTAIIADGFSCREAIHQNSSRRGIHLAELLDLAGRPDRDTAPPEVLTRAPLEAARRAAQRQIAVGLAAGLAVGLLVLLKRSR